MFSRVYRDSSVLEFPIHLRNVIEESNNSTYIHFHNLDYSMVCFMKFTVTIIFTWFTEVTLNTNVPDKVLRI